jgi:hypothetical protein
MGCRRTEEEIVVLQHIWRRSELEAASPRMARKLVDTLYNQISSLVIGASIVHYAGPDRLRWHWLVLVSGCLAFSFGTLLWRLRQCRVHSRNPGSATPQVWAQRFTRGA